ncbi:Multistep phosphorelay regulator 1 [Penicillium diatomitis]|uniref:Multistep phosphorelay regulator 1 n=1 Tax=Penicillium diatomitis TaxID=2819901 RepID=A0A9W9X6M3_9EURO|nr:Multistep phosphorelay regulator 1 [Penicillium diatomitis]KAJ5485303.1 Multistep phosphorelay regulator 1 [Penicillium diatomitis]
MAPADRKEAKAAPPKLSDVKDLIDEGTFEQILEMDDDDDCDFSRGIVYGFFDQAKSTFTNIKTALDKKDLHELSQLGHFLKGSSATLGLIHVRDGCEKIQHFGNGLEENGSGKLADDVALKNIEKTLKEVEVEYAKVEKFLRRFYGEEVKDEPEVKEPEAKAAPKSDAKEEKPLTDSEKAAEKKADKEPEKTAEPSKNHVAEEKPKADAELKK